ncbi:MAG: DMT family transporter [Alphaproteobacteria bacterium]|nr:MAG: DMT family transporter [Alphaproteobacteria bacterium]
MAPKHLGLALLVTLLWGYNFVVTKVGVTELPPIFFAAYRYALVAVMLLPWLKPLKGQMKRIVWIALTSGAFHFGLIFVGFSMTDSIGPVAVAVQINVPFMLLLAVVFLGEKIGRIRIAGMVMAFIGVMIVGFDPVAFQSPWALAAVVTGGCMFGISVILMRRLDGGHPLQVQAWIAVISLPFLAAGSFMFESGQFASVVDFGWLGIAVVLYASLGATVIGHGSMFVLLQRYPVTYLMPFMIAPPVLGVFFGIVLNDEAITWKIAIGGLMTLVGVGIIQIREARMVAETQPTEAGV